MSRSGRCRRTERERRVGGHRSCAGAGGARRIRGAGAECGQCRVGACGRREVCGAARLRQRRGAGPQCGSRSRGGDGEGSAPPGAHWARAGSGEARLQRVAARCRPRAGRGAGRPRPAQGCAHGRWPAGPVGSAASVSAGPGRRGLRGAGAVDQHARVGFDRGRHLRRQPCVHSGRHQRRHAAVDPLRARGRRADHGARGVPRGVGSHRAHGEHDHPGHAVHWADVNAAA